MPRQPPVAVAQPPARARARARARNAAYLKDARAPRDSFPLAAFFRVLRAAFSTVVLEFGSASIASEAAHIVRIARLPTRWLHADVNAPLAARLRACAANMLGATSSRLSALLLLVTVSVATCAWQFEPGQAGLQYYVATPIGSNIGTGAGAAVGSSSSGGSIGDDNAGFVSGDGRHVRRHSPPHSAAASEALAVAAPAAAILAIAIVAAVEARARLVARRRQVGAARSAASSAMSARVLIKMRQTKFCGCTPTDGLSSVHFLSSPSFTRALNSLNK